MLESFSNLKLIWMSVDYNEFGLTSKDSEEMNFVFRGPIGLKKVILFGSRALGKFRPGSDVDLALVCDENFNGFQFVSSALNEATNIPLYFDVVEYHKIRNEKLKEHIDRVGKIIYQA